MTTSQRVAAARGGDTRMCKLRPHLRSLTPWTGKRGGEQRPKSCHEKKLELKCYTSKPKMEKQGLL